jgi:hypothetical protein
LIFAFSEASLAAGFGAGAGVAGADFGVTSGITRFRILPARGVLGTMSSWGEGTAAMRDRSICDPGTAGLIPELFAASVSGIDKNRLKVLIGRQSSFLEQFHNK